MLRMDLSLAHLRTLAAVVRHRSFSKAAAERRLTQPAVSQHVRALEDAVGERLVERLGKRAFATPAAEVLLVRAERAFDELDAAREDIQRLKGTVSGCIRLGTGATASIYVLPKILGRLRARHPNLDFCVVTGNTPDVIADLIANELDLAVVTLPVPRQRLTVAATCVGALVGIAPPGHVLAGANALGPRVLGDQPLILYEKGSATRAAIDHWFQRAACTPRVVMELGNVEAIKKMVGAGLGLSLLPEVAVAAEIASGELARLSLRPPLERQLGVVHRTDRIMTPALKTAIDALVEGLSAYPQGKAARP